MKKINKILCLLMIATTITSCDNYLDVNDDPNNPLIENVSPDLMLAGAQEITADVYAVQLNRLGSTLSGAWGGNVLTTADPFGNEFRYNFTSTFNSFVWDGLYTYTANFTTIVNYESEQNYNNHKAIAKILRAFYTQYLVDLYGDIPYFERHQYTNALQVAYDNDAQIYNDLLQELNSAVSMINSTATSVGSEDIYYGGDMEKWRKFANTLKLRLIVRQSNVISLQDAQNALTGLTSSDFIGFGDGANVNPGYAKENNRQNPFYNNFGFSADGAQERNRTITASIFAIQTVDGTLSGVNDNRISRMYRVNSANNYVGIEQGQTLGGIDPQTGIDGISLLGAGYGVDQESIANATKSLPIFTEAESFFLQAEAHVRNYVNFSTTQSLFNNGIQASFSLLGASGGSTYASNVNGVAGFGLTGTQNQDIEAIITQKWIALHTIGGVEPWLEMTRTGFPNAPLPINQTNTQRPVKLLYPLSELQGNSANVPVSQSTSDAFIRTTFWN